MIEQSSFEWMKLFTVKLTFDGKKDANFLFNTCVRSFVTFIFLSFRRNTIVLEKAPEVIFAFFSRREFEFFLKLKGEDFATTRYRRNNRFCEKISISWRGLKKKKSNLPSCALSSRSVWLPRNWKRSSKLGRSGRRRRGILYRSRSWLRDRGAPRTRCKTRSPPPARNFPIRTMAAKRGIARKSRQRMPVWPRVYRKQTVSTILKRSVKRVKCVYLQFIYIYSYPLLFGKPLFVSTRRFNVVPRCEKFTVEVVSKIYFVHSSSTRPFKNRLFYH